MDVNSPALAKNWKFKTGSKYRVIPDHQQLLSRLISSIVRISLLRLMADEMDLQLLAVLNIGWKVLNTDDVVWQTVLVSPEVLALAAFIKSSGRVFDDSTILFSRSPHETSCSPQPASKSGKMKRQGVVRNLRMVPSGFSRRIFSSCNKPGANARHRPGRLGAHLRRRRRPGAKHGCGCQGRTAGPKKALARVVKAAFPDWGVTWN
jgi:hypothetical protein